ncbi:MAG TPA: GNAT family N-acetyltransferase [Arachidicoccus sp.]|nr:GNAT family N-acetyltransferase [Arachidicoccus sp.]
MLPEYQSLVLEDNRTEGKFELPLEDGFAYMDYRDHGDLFFLMHTEVSENMEGKGAATALAEKVFTLLEEKGIKVKIYCSYLVTWLKRHPEYNHMIANN